MERPKAKERSFQRSRSGLTSAANHDVSMLVVTELLGDHQHPLVYTPNHDDIDLAEWASNNRDTIAANLHRYGALLFRGFPMQGAVEFEEFAKSISPELFNENGEHPREAVGGSVYTPVFYPPEHKLLWHNENSFNYQWPLKIWFGCMRPADTGGETPIVDSRKIYERISPKIRDRFSEKGIMYTRNFNTGLGLDWPTVFQTSDRSVVEEECRATKTDWKWKGEDGLKTMTVRPAVAKHPHTGELVWFNQAQHWHVSCLDAATRESIASIFQEDDYPRNCYYGDGSPIESSVMEEICGVYQDLEVSFPWRTGDVMMLDNMLTAHARNPFTGPRKLLVAMAELVSADEV